MLQRGTGVIVGQVIDATSGRAVGGALVTLDVSGTTAPAGGAAVTSGAGAVPATQDVIADADGRFVFHDLPRATYNLSASSSGYFGGPFGRIRPGGPGQTIDLDTDQRITDAKIRIWRLGVITGAVTDENGEPIAGVTVRVLRRTVVSGRRRLTPASSTSTDDRGVYRFPALTPGDFIVAVPANTATLPTSIVDEYAQSVVSQSRASTQPLVQDLSSSGAPSPAVAGYRLGNSQIQQTSALSRLAPPPSESNRIFTYQTTFYSATTAVGQAQVISLASGEERAGIDLQMKLVPTARVSGTVTGSDGAAVPNIGLRLIPADARDWTDDTAYEAAATATDGQGRFTFLGVPAGQYLARVRRTSGRAGGPSGLTATLLTAEVPVSVGEADLADVAVPLRPGVRFSGRVEFEGTAPRPTADRLQQISVNVAPADGRNRDLPPAVRVSTDGQFTTPQYAPGQYIVTASSTSGPWVLKSIVVGNRDVSQMPLPLESGDVSGVIVTYTDRQTQLSGAIQGSSRPQLETLVVVFPASYQQWIDNGLSSRLGRSVRPGKTGTYTINNLPAGDYLIAALPDVLTNEWQDSAMLAGIARVASRVSIADGEKKTIDLSVSTIR